MRFATPILFLAYNRPQTTSRVFEAIRQRRPERLYLAADGPRESVKGDREECEKVRHLLERSVDWECKVQTLFREENLGCKAAVSEAIHWIFEQEDRAIILEDDCLPDPSFFDFCSLMLDKYSDDERVMMVSGTNYINEPAGLRTSYYFSRYFAIWGWGTWKRAWKKYDVSMRHWPEWKRKNALTRLLPAGIFATEYESMFDSAFRNLINTWDIQWVYTCVFERGMSLVPRMNLVSNIGIAGSHTTEKPSQFVNMLRHAFDIENIVHPSDVQVDVNLDRMVHDRIFGAAPDRGPRFVASAILRKLGRSMPKVLRSLAGRG